MGQILEIGADLRLLVVDDGEGYAEAIERIAASSPLPYNLEVKVASNHARVVELMRDWSPSVVILDSHIFEIDSLDLLNGCLRGLVPVIVASEMVSHEIENAVRNRGASGYMAKSENPEDIEALLTDLTDLATNFEECH